MAKRPANPNIRGLMACECLGCSKCFDCETFERKCVMIKKRTLDDSVCKNCPGKLTKCDLFDKIIEPRNIVIPESEVLIV